MLLFAVEWRRKSELESGDIYVNCEEVPVLGAVVWKELLAIGQLGRISVKVGRRKNIACRFTKYTQSGCDFGLSIVQKSRTSYNFFYFDPLKRDPLKISTGR